MPVKINGTTSGSVTLAAPATGSDVTLTLPGSTGTVALTTGAGLQFITSQEFSAVSSVSVNNCFSATYSRYLITRDLVGSVIDQNINMRLRVAGSDASGANYRRQTLDANATTVSAARTTGETSWVAALAYTETGGAFGLAQMWINNPFEAVRTTAFAENGYDHDDQLTILLRACAHDLATSYDGFSFYPPSGTMTGTVRVYGLKN